MRNKLVFKNISSIDTNFKDLKIVLLDMDLQTKKLHFIQEILAASNEKIIDKLASVLRKEQQNIDPVLKEKLTKRILRANEDIKEDKLYSRKEAEVKIRKKPDL